jgi:hypothetical protein
MPIRASRLAALGLWAALGSCNSLFGINEPRDATLPRIRVTRAPPGPLHGGDGGAPAEMPCADDEALIGLRVLATDTVWGLGVECGRMDLSRDANGYNVSVVQVSRSVPLGGNVETTPPLTISELPCPPSTVVTAVDTTTWLGLSSATLKTISFSCSEVIVTSARQLALAPPSGFLEAGVADTGVMSFSDSCPGTGVVVGFTGRSGAAIDAIAVDCGTLSLDGDLP